MSDFYFPRQFSVVGIRLGNYRLIHDFSCKESKDMYYPELAKGIRHFKEEEGGRVIMCEAVERYAEKYAEKYAERYAEGKRIDTLYETVKNLMETMQLSAEQAMSAIKISENDRMILQKRL